MSYAAVGWVWWTSISNSWTSWGRVSLLPRALVLRWARYASVYRYWPNLLWRVPTTLVLHCAGGRWASTHNAAPQRLATSCRTLLHLHLPGAQTGPGRPPRLPSHQTQTAFASAPHSQKSWQVDVATLCTRGSVVVQMCWLMVMISWLGSALSLPLT